MTPVTPPPMFGVFHISFVLLGTVFAVLLAKRASRLPFPARIRLFCCIGWGMALSEAAKQLFYYHVVNGRCFDWWLFPFQLCSVPMYLCILLPLLSTESENLPPCGRGGRFPAVLRRKAQTSVCTFLATYSLFGAAMALIWPEDMLRPWPLMTLHGFLWHLVLVFLSLTVIFSSVPRAGSRPAAGSDSSSDFHAGAGSASTADFLSGEGSGSSADFRPMADFSRRGFFRATLLFWGLAAIATIINIWGWHHPSLPGSYPDMFYITPYVMTPQPVVRTVAEHIGIIPANMLYLLSISFFSGLICLAVRRALR